MMRFILKLHPASDDPNESCFISFDYTLQKEHVNAQQESCKSLGYLKEFNPISVGNIPNLDLFILTELQEAITQFKKQLQGDNNDTN